MAGKYQVVLNAKPRFVEATLPNSRGADYTVEVNPAGNLRILNSLGWDGAMRACNIISDIGSKPVKKGEVTENFVYLGEQKRMLGSVKDSTLVLTVTQEKMRLHMHPRLTEREDETRLFGNACVILDHAIKYVENQENYFSIQ